MSNAESFRYYRRMGATPKEAIEAARMEPTEQTACWVIDGILVEFNPWLRQYVVHLPKRERYFFDRMAAIRQARDWRLVRRQRRRGERSFL